MRIRSGIRFLWNPDSGGRDGVRPLPVMTRRGPRAPGLSTRRTGGPRREYDPFVCGRSLGVLRGSLPLTGPPSASTSVLPSRSPTLPTSSSRRDSYTGLLDSLGQHVVHLLLTRSLPLESCHGTSKSLCGPRIDSCVSAWDNGVVSPRRHTPTIPVFSRVL